MIPAATNCTCDSCHKVTHEATQAGACTIGSFSDSWQMGQIGSDVIGMVRLPPADPKRHAHVRQGPKPENPTHHPVGARIATQRAHYTRLRVAPIPEHQCDAQRESTRNMLVRIGRPKAVRREVGDVCKGGAA